MMEKGTQKEMNDIEKGREKGETWTDKNKE